MIEPVRSDGVVFDFIATGAGPTADVLTNAAWDSAPSGSPLSVVVPFFNYDVNALATRLLQLADKLRVLVPIVFVDDGSPSPMFNRRLWSLLLNAEQPCAMAVLHQNVGRSKVRNYLSRIARTSYLLYLDADMWPDSPDFLNRYLAWATAGDVDVLYGGRSADKVILNGPAYELHRLMTVQREALPAVVRRQSPAYHFYSCNFMVRRELLSAFPLDERFTGWGWEDCEWASRVAEHHEIRHEDNSASHLGLLTASEILEKYDESIVNFSFLLQSRPELVISTALFRVARGIGRLGLASMVTAVARKMAVSSRLPMTLRMRGLMLYKASLYSVLAKHVGD